MGTTITVARVEDDGSVTFGHVGDSRAYLLRGNDLEQLTDDHSLVAELVRRGELSAEAAEVHPQRSVITRALGTDPDVDVDAFSVDGEAGRPLPDLLGRALGHGRRHDDRGDPARAPGEPRRRRPLARPRGQPRRWRRQHHRDPLRARAGARHCAASPTRRRANTRRRSTKRTRSIRRTASLRRRRPSRRPSRPLAPRKPRPRRQGSADGSWRSP